RLGYLDPGKVRAQSVPAAGGVRGQDRQLTAAAPDVEDVLPVLDHRGRQHPLMPLALLDELPPAGPVPVLSLRRIHRHEGHATGGSARSGPAKVSRARVAQSRSNSLPSMSCITMQDS